VSLLRGLCKRKCCLVTEGFTSLNGDIVTVLLLVTVVVVVVIDGVATLIVFSVFGDLANPRRRWY
jgi:hypothetical protein